MNSKINQKNKFILINPAANETVKEMTILADDVSDGYHTMSELYEHRMYLNIALFNILANDDAGRCQVMKSQKHFDDSMYSDYFIVLAITPFGHISYHYKMEHWDKFRIPIVDNTPEYDGYKDAEIYHRLMQL